MTRTRRPYRPTGAQRAMARTIHFCYVERFAETLARQAGTTLSGATRTLRSMEDHGLARSNATGRWSLTSAGEKLL